MLLRNQKGMTLIEIMIVVAILGGLMTILGQTVFKQFSKARTKQARIQILEMSKSLELYATDCGSFPTESQGLEALLEEPGDGCDNWGPDPYLKRKMLTDPWNSEIIYSVEGSDFDLISLGADKVEGGKGNDKDINYIDL